jgi:predicted HicB family RNase H-like nuclease
MSIRRSTVQIPSETHEKLSRAAKKNKMAIGALLAEIIDRYVDTMKSRDEYEAELAKLRQQQ